MEIIPVIRHAKIVGNYFRPKEDQIHFRELPEKSPLTFELEPTNAVDPFAVKIISHAGVFIGYIPKEFSGVVYALSHLDEGQVIIHGIYHGKAEFSMGIMK